MIRPVMMNNNMNFKGWTIIGGEDDSNSKTPEKTLLEEKLERMSRYKQHPLDIKNKMIVGALCGAILGIGGTSIYKDSQIDSILRNIAADRTYEDVDTLKIEDATNDKIPDIILQDKNGDETVYDLTSGSIYFKEDNELIKRD